MRQRSFAVWIAGVAALSLAAAAACSGASSPPVAPPSPTPRASSTPAPVVTAVATPTPAVAVASAATPQSLDDALDQLEAHVARLRGLPATGETRRRFVDDSRLRAIVGDALDAPDAVAAIEAEERLYKLLGLIEATADLKSIYRDLLGDQVLGLYRAETGEFFVLSTGDFGALERVTYAHEYVHHLQDASFGLEALHHEAMGNRELEGALSALVEGDATLAQYDFMREALSQRELIALLATALSLNVSANEAPAIVQSWLEFPYVEGLAFAAALRANGGTKQVNAAFDALPATTEQILHPARYFAGEPALAVSLPDAGALLGPGWEVAEQNVLGEFFLRAWLEALGVPPRAAAGAAAGWGGDAYVVLRSGESGAALAARIVWDDAAAGGDEFVSAIAAALDATPTFAMREELALPVDGATGLTWAGPGGVLGVARFADGGVGIAVTPAGRLTELLLGALAPAPRRTASPPGAR